MYNWRLTKGQGGFWPTKPKNTEGTTTGSLEIWEEVEETREGCRELDRGENTSIWEVKADRDSAWSVTAGDSHMMKLGPAVMAVCSLEDVR